MSRRVFCIACCVLAVGFLASAQTPVAQTAKLRIIVPQKDAAVQFDGVATKAKGTERTFATPPLEAGWTYSYELTATWWPNNYTKVIRVRKISVRPGQDVEVDFRAADPANPDRYHIRFVPTPEDIVEAMCKLADVGKNDVVYDLGCGDGRMVITAVKDFKAKRGVGVDIDAGLVEQSIKEAKLARVDDRVRFRKQDVLDIKDLSDASVVMMYMGEDVNLRLMPILKKTLKKGSRIVSHDFAMGDWKPDAKITVFSQEDGDDHELYLWTIK